ncbi:hypothetical protein R3P38DRAFT_1376599 [Favolaschia claudopus]|uniref:Secreted protein n=1 Tax=Favolaschia claudopus TaxID=2862362 RepID=A0AAW0DXU1_9AGAR
MQLPQAHLVVLAACTLSVSLVSGHASRRGEPNRDPFGGGGLNATAINNATNTPDPIVVRLCLSPFFTLTCPPCTCSPQYRSPPASSMPPLPLCHPQSIR